MIVHRTHHDEELNITVKLLFRPDQKNPFQVQQRDEDAEEIIEHRMFSTAGLAGSYFDRVVDAL